MQTQVNISFEELTKMISQFADGSVNQTQPQIIWFDNIAEIARFGSVADYASYLSSRNDRIAYDFNAGSPLTDKRHRFNNNGEIVKITDEERFSLAIPVPPIKLDENNHIHTRVYIHSPYIAYIGENGLTSLEQGVMLFNNLHIAVLLMYPLAWRERILKAGNADDYEELFCVAQIEESVRKWLSGAERRVNRFYLNFLRNSPLKHVTSKLDPLYADGNIGATFCSPERWEQISYKSEEAVKNLVISCAKDSDIDEIKQYFPLISGHEIHFDKLERVLDIVSEKEWQGWLSQCGSWAFNVNSNLSESSPRINVFKSYLCSFPILGNIPDDTVQELLKYHNL